LKFSAWLALLAAIAVPAVAGEASGEFKVTGRNPIRPKYAAAFETRDKRDPHKRVVEVVLSSSPIDAAAAANDLDPHANAINQPALMDNDYILLWVRPGNDVSMNATYGARMVQFVDMTPEGLSAEIATLTPDRVAGRVWSPKPVKTQDESWTVDVRFSADVARTPAGTKLPADGGEPGKALRAMKERPVMLPKGKMKVVGGELRGDAAILEVEGEMFPGQRALYLVRMTKSGAKWVFDRATTAGFID
jgi:hypothetical protein